MLQLETKADLIHAAILEDRQEIRGLKDRIWQITSTLTAASFAVTAFAIGRYEWPHARSLLLVAEPGFLALLWAAFLPLRKDLRGARGILEHREDMLQKLGTPDEKVPFNLYPVVPLDKKPRMRDPAIDWLVGTATGTLAIKMVISLVAVG
jgi:hypothetical protein